jgi:iron complex outermembrane receptor protein
MLKPGSRLGGAMVAVTGLLIADARLALAQEQTQEGIQEVVVTAQRREENLQTTPIAITALSAETLNKQGVTDFAGVAQQSTSINFTPYPSSSNTLILYMRGQGVADANQITQDGSVGLYEDGFYIARPQAETFDLADVDRVEILRGPQGTLYGRNTTGGAVNIISKKPTGEFDIKFSVDGGQRHYVRALGTMNLPTLAGGLSSKITVLYSNLAGNVSNSGGEDFNRENQKGARVSLRWDTGGMFTADYFYEVGEIDSTGIYYQDPALSGVIPGYPATVGLAGNTWEPIFLPVSVAKFTSDGLTLNFKFNDAATFRSLTYYRGLDSRFYQDYAGAFTDPAGAPAAGITNFTSDDVVQSNEFTQEFQLVGNIGKKVDYVAGLYYFDEHANHAEFGTIDIPREYVPGIPLFTEATSRYVTADAKSKAAYAQFTWHVTDPLSLTIGGRYTKDDRSATRDATTQGAAFIPFSLSFLSLNRKSARTATWLSKSSIPPARLIWRGRRISTYFHMRLVTRPAVPRSRTHRRFWSGVLSGMSPPDWDSIVLGSSTSCGRMSRCSTAVQRHAAAVQRRSTNLAIVQSYNAKPATVNGASSNSFMHDQ